jgi:hypothetical protein
MPRSRIRRREVISVAKEEDRSLILRSRMYEVGAKAGPEEVKRLLRRAIDETPLEDIRNARALFASFRGGRITVIV